ncbi:SH3 domain-containing protein [Desulfovibrio sp. JC010]|uniref:SH3 domain-containing protein n=1 Tax=Desulfovibrio sp. JC010 TaxID=2593641 RepID=UPI0013D60D59|nr:SH3 domain-containing protein [Desulfovibrio sp. JC010]NDV28357.1 SH3 domain-containing protein [Desulfovibrio sp. JC010]
MSSRLVSYVLVSLALCLLAAGCIPQKNKQQNNAVKTAVRTETVVITPVVTGRSLLKSNVREVSSSKADIVDILARNTQVELVGKNGNWYKIKRMDGSGKPGFVYHKLINLDFGNYLGTRGRNKEKAVVYEAASKKSPSVRILQPQTTFDIMGVENDFYLIKGEDFEGYAFTKVCVADPLTPIAKTETRTFTAKVVPEDSGSTNIAAATPAKKFAPKPKKEKIKIRTSTKTKKKTVKKKSSGDNQAAMALFGAFAQALMGGGQKNMQAAQPQSTNDALINILKTLDTSKELAKKTVEIREQMLGALNETRALQSLVGKTVSAMNQNYKAAADTARGVSSTGMKKISIKAFIKDLSYEPTDSIEGAAVKIAENGRMLKALESRIKSEAADFSQLNAAQLQNLDSIISSFSTNLHASNALYDMSMDKSGNVILSIDRAMNSYAEKGEQMSAEVTKQLTIIGLSIAELVAQISNAQNNPIGAIAALPRLMDTMEQFESLQSLFNDFEADFNYIEGNSAVITKQGKDISSIIMTARRKNTQVTTMLESYYQQKLTLSSRLKKKLASQAASGFKQVEEKASSVALAEDMLD